MASFLYAACFSLPLTHSLTRYAYSWLTFLLSAFLAFDSFGTYKSGGEATTQSDHNGDGDIEVENIDDSNL